MPSIQFPELVFAAFLEKARNELPVIELTLVELIVELIVESIRRR